MKAYWGSEGTSRIFDSALDGGEWSASRSSRFTSGKEPLVPIVYEAEWVPEPVWTRW
jgi:hypothetical protein